MRRKYANKHEENLARNTAKKLRYANDPLFRDTLIARNKNWRALRLQRMREQKREKMYHLTKEQFEIKLKDQDYRCAICGTTDPGGRGWQVDHDHGCCPGRDTCGNCIRGILCVRCNSLLGFALDSPKRLGAAISYLHAEQTWMTTYTGQRFFLLNPQPERIDIQDVAHSLSMLCRFTGATSRFYSVGEHSWLASTLVRPEFALDALLHDAHEAYVNDLSAPLKKETGVGEVYEPIANKIQLAIEKKFNLNQHEHHTQCPSCDGPCEVKAADTSLLYREKEVLLPPMSWDGKWNEDRYTPVTVPIVGYTPLWAERLFLERFRELTSNKINAALSEG